MKKATAILIGWSIQIVLTAGLGTYCLRTNSYWLAFLNIGLNIVGMVGFNRTWRVVEADRANYPTITKDKGSLKG